MVVGDGGDGKKGDNVDLKQGCDKRRGQQNAKLLHNLCFS